MNGLEQMGLVVHRGRMLWGYKHGALSWLPHWARKAIVHAWNWTACLVIGCDTMPEISSRCFYCLRKAVR